MIERRYKKTGSAAQFGGTDIWMGSVRYAHCRTWDVAVWLHGVTVVAGESLSLSLVMHERGRTGQAGNELGGASQPALAWLLGCLLGCLLDSIGFFLPHTHTLPASHD